MVIKANHKTELNPSKDKITVAYYPTIDNKIESNGELNSLRGSKYKVETFLINQLIVTPSISPNTKIWIIILVIISFGLALSILIIVILIRTIKKYNSSQTRQSSFNSEVIDSYLSHVSSLDRMD